MPVDNTIYDRLAPSWWAPEGVLHLLAGLVPPRLGYMRRVLEQRGVSPNGQPVLDVGSGGGHLAEAFAQAGFTVTGVDPSRASLAAARAHRAEAGLPIQYLRAAGECLPFPDASFAVVYCCDVLEHVDEPRRVVAESARVLRPGGVYLYDTINRSWRSWLVMIKLLQDWRWSRLLPARLHEWRGFIRPSEMSEILEAAGLRAAPVTGLAPRANPLEALRAIVAGHRGRITYRQAMERLEIREARDDSMWYAGYAVKPAA